ncbi:MAG: HEAT repeat domain-containing protein [Nostoc sp. NMS1]|uniref:HEAT repeat domain-containing protein n=1 Tax=unclassified Nostoc TaxID=2593658 RepID=UPI0025E5FCEB|nr:MULTISPECIES: HEAT repeat domain-containing protein [unclassified Nostoc]MBN3908608.1 HEAT repeat domain-containing protein [Nostoc sp. NMS1]MBN3994518.1 HEAT repeat domain-containing protein [Nostoc sp. NMS2]
MNYGTNTLTVYDNSTDITIATYSDRIKSPNIVISSTKSAVNLTSKVKQFTFSQKATGATKDPKIEQNTLIHLKSSENSTQHELNNRCSEIIYSELETLFITGKEEYFEDGFESNFSRGLISCVQKYGNDAIEAITCFIVYEKISPEVASEALRWLGEINHPESYKFRLWLLERSLNCPSSRVRDGAILGLSYLNDPHAITYLERAIEQEKIMELREDMKQVLAQLKRES